MQKIVPLNKEHWLKLRSMDVTSTEVSCLFNLNPYMTKYELWHNKKDEVVVKIDETERMRWGTRLEPVIAKGIAEDKGWQIRHMPEYIRDENLRAGSSFDYSIEGDVPGILEIKNVDTLIFKDGWEIDEDGNLEAPPHIELQVQHQLMLTDRTFAYIGALVGGNNLQLIRRDRSDNIIKAIKKEIKAFWVSVIENNPPEIDWEKDSDFIIKLNQYSQPEKVMTLVNPEDELFDLTSQYKEVMAKEKELSSKKNELKAKVLQIIGDHEKVTSNKFTISAGMIGPAELSFTRKGYRNFKISFKKEKNESV